MSHAGQQRPNAPLTPRGRLRIEVQSIDLERVPPDSVFALEPPAGSGIEVRSLHDLLAGGAPPRTKPSEPRP